MKQLQYLFTFIFTLINLNSYAANSKSEVRSTEISKSSIEEKFYLLIDPGHGGNDIGASRNNIKESELVLKIGQKIKLLIETQYPEIQAELSRSENKFLTLEDRIKNKEPDLFLSLHANSSISSKVFGMETYFQPDQKMIAKSTKEHILKDLVSLGKTNQSLKFSKSLQKNWTSSPSVLKRSSFYVVEKANSPSVLIELGFLTHPAEAQKLSTEAYQTEIAETIVKSVIEYKKNSR